MHGCGGKGALAWEGCTARICADVRGCARGLSLGRGAQFVLSGAFCWTGFIRTVGALVATKCVRGVAFARIEQRRENHTQQDRTVSASLKMQAADMAEIIMRAF